MITKQSQINHDISHKAWLLMGFALLSIITLTFFKQYANASLAALAISFIASIIRPAYGVILTIAYFTCDQFINGASPFTFTFGRYLIVLNIAFCLPQFIKDKEFSKITNIQFLFYFILLFVGIVSLAWIENFDRGTNYILKLAILIIWARVVIPTICNTNLLISLSGIMSLITGLLALIFIFGGVGRYSNINDRLLLEGLGINSIATSFGFVIIFATLFLSSSNNKINKIIILLSCLLIYISIILMGTRSVAFGIPLTFIVSIFFLKPRYFIKYLPLAIIAIVIAIIILIGALNTGLISEKLYERFFGLTSADTFTKNSRVDLARYSLSYVFSNPMGSGVGNEHKVFENFHYNVPLYESHNTYISTMVQFGVFGFVLFITPIIICGFNLAKIKDPKHRFHCAALFLFFIIMIAKASLLQTRLFWIPMTIILAYIEHYLRIERKLKKYRYRILRKLT